MWRLSPIAVAISAASANMVAASACLSFLERHLGDVDERQGDPGYVADPAAHLQALLEVSGRPLVLSEHLHRPAEVVQRDREHEVVACRARESDRFLARGQCRPRIGRATGVSARIAQRVAAAIAAAAVAPTSFA